MTTRALYCRHVVHSAGNDSNTEWRFLTLCPQVLQVLKECLWEAFHPSKQAGRISVISFTFRAQHDALAYTKLEWLFYGIFLFTLRAQSDALTYTKLEWFFYCIFCSHSAYNLTLQRILCLPTNVGLAQAGPNKLARFLKILSHFLRSSPSIKRCFFVSDKFCICLFVLYLAVPEVLAVHLRYKLICF